MIRLRLGGLGLEHDRNYGCDKRTGWSSTVRGHYVAQLTSLHRALWALLAFREES